MTTVTYYMSNPQIRVSVTHSGTTTNYDNAIFSNLSIRRVDNGIDQALLTFADTKSRYYDSAITKGDTVEVKVKDSSDSTAWASVTAIFDGKIYLARPLITPDGELTVAQADGSGYGLMQMLCADEYGTQSNNSSLDTIKEIVEDTNEGLIPEYVNDILNSGTSSGFSYTTEVETITGTIPYLEFPYKPCHKVMADLCDIVTALKAGSAGPHWIVDTSDRVLVATVGSHGSPASTYWPTWLNDTTDNTLEQGLDFNQFNFEELDKEANYVLYHGKFMRPVHDIWTEGNASDWDKSDTGCSAPSDEASNKIVGSYSVELYNNSVSGTHSYWYPSSNDLGLNLTVFGGEKTPADICFYARLDYSSAPTDVTIRMWSSAGNYYEHSFKTAVDLGTTGKFIHFRFPLGDYYPQERYPGFNGWTETGTGDWTSINRIEFYVPTAGVTNPVYLWVDDLRFEGKVLRAARQSSAYSSSDPCKMVVVTDNIGKDDTGKSGTPGTTDLGTIALMAKAEYYRLSTTPIIGFVKTPMIKDALAGQLVHIHAKKKADGTFTIDKNMRILKVIHAITGTEQGCTTTLELTDDATNGRARTRFGDINKVLQSARPEFQDRQASSIKMPELDITQSILTESY